MLPRQTTRVSLGTKEQIMKSVKASLPFAGLAPGLMLTARVSVDREGAHRISSRFRFTR